MTESAPRSRRPLMLGAVLIGLLGVGAALYGSFSGDHNRTTAECRAARPVAERLAGLARGEVAAVTVARDPGPLPDLAFTDPQGRATSLREMKGRTVLLNLWATWCAPCRQEMPALDKLQAEFGGPGFEVVAINIDQRNLERPKAWLKEAGVTRLAYYADPQAKVFQDLRQAGKAVGMPTTFLLDPNGCELAALSGPADWASEDARRLVQAAMTRP
ncbi:MAG: Thiol:disulfide oxidoreductase TlpA [uncultured Microvirga sp.]|uniref:Thiol:disulfide oxidoreductase TlpA n=1 Tax=uncultured Microvirga sp. TaxID=412392 RepID=A0A6J4LI07_9HYPH|nr:MAG: Thiol:disulfide oxidoreductase TlpA [uncultured Microvirga sp.]